METKRRPHRIVVVDDSFDLRTMLALRLAQHEQIIVGMAADGLQAIDIVDRARPNLVIMDLEMPRMDGFEAANEIRQRHPDVHLVALTSQGREESRERALQSGFDAFVVKGGPLQELDEVLEQFHSAA